MNNNSYTAVNKVGISTGGGGDRDVGGAGNSYGSYNGNYFSNSGNNHGDGVMENENNAASMIRNVWASNIEEEFARITKLAKEYNVVAVDTEFPGVVVKPVGNFKNPQEYYFHNIRVNVNMLRIIQIGLSLFNSHGEVPEEICTWQFNFFFHINNDMYAKDSIDLLKGSGIDFERFIHDGIDPHHFAELLTTSGLVLNQDVLWLGFHAGYDFGYLVKILTNSQIPETEDEFNAVFRTLFPSVLDIKCFLRSTEIPHSAGLDFLANLLSVWRLGTAHQAGSDSLLTGHCFFKLIRDNLSKYKRPEEYKGYLYGLTDDARIASTIGNLNTSGGSVSNSNCGVNSAFSGMMTNSTGGGGNSNAYGSNNSNNNNFSSSLQGNSASTPTSLIMHGGSKDSKIHYAR